VGDFIEVPPKKLGGPSIFQRTRIPMRTLSSSLDESYAVDALPDRYNSGSDRIHGSVSALRDSFAL